jgi:hypothetical protein
MPDDEPIDLDAIEDRLGAATPGPWEWASSTWLLGPKHAEVLDVRADIDRHGAPVVEMEGDDADRALIAHAPADLAALVARSGACAASAIGTS